MHAFNHLNLNLVNSNESWSKHFEDKELRSGVKKFLDFVCCEDKKAVEFQIEKVFKK